MQNKWSIQKYADGRLDGFHAVSAQTFYENEVIYKTRLSSANTTAVRTRTSVQISEDEHLEDPLLMFMDHSNEPSTWFRVEYDDGYFLVVRANRRISAGEALTFHYATTETEMSCPFIDADTGVKVNGFKSLSEAEQRKLNSYLFPHVRELLGA